VRSRTAHCRKHASAPIGRSVGSDRRSFRSSCWSGPVNYERPSRHASDGSINRYYDPATGQFLTVDPDVAITQAPYTYAGDDPVNNTDPTGLCWGPGCWAQSAANTVANGAARTWNATGGQVVHAAATGTYGVCISGAIGWGPGGTADGCFVESHFFQHGGFTGTLGGGGQSPTAGIGIGFLSSNASSPGQLSGPFGYANGSVVVGPDVGLYAGGEGFIGKDSCNSTIVGSVSGVGLGADLPLPFGFGGGASYTWVGQLW
jgi:RHS repeat-associated protein